MDRSAAVEATYAWTRAAAVRTVVVNAIGAAVLLPVVGAIAGASLWRLVQPLAALGLELGHVWHVHDDTPAPTESPADGESVSGRQSKGKCLLEPPRCGCDQSKPVASSLSTTPHVATCPGPTSAPGAFVVVTRRSGSAVGPVSAATCRSTFPGIPALQ